MRTHAGPLLTLLLSCHLLVGAAGAQTCEGVVFPEGWVQPLSSDQFESMCLADIDGDGDLDLLITGDFAGHSNSLAMYRNQGLGSFAKREVIPIGGDLGGLYIARIATGDLDGDGSMDLVLVPPEGYDNHGPLALWNDGFGAFTADDVAPGAQDFIAVVDLDGDALPEIVTIDLTGDLLVLWNQGARAFTEEHLADETYTVAEVQARDLDDDGWTDIVITEPDLGLGVLWNDEGVLESPVFVTPPPTDPAYPSGPFSRSLLGDFDGDGDADVVLTSAINVDCDPADPGPYPCDPPSDMVINDGGRTLVHTGGTTIEYYINGNFYGLSRLMVADVNHDGIDDVLHGSYVYYGDPSGQFIPDNNCYLQASEYGEQHPPHAVGDIDGDGLDDLVYTHTVVTAHPYTPPTREDGIYAYRSAGATNTSPPQDIDIPFIRAVGDREGNGVPDIMTGWGEYWPGIPGGLAYRYIAWAPLRKDGRFTGELLQMDSYNYYSPPSMVTDLNRDGASDLLYFENRELDIQWNDGTGEFETEVALFYPPSTSSYLRSPKGLAIADFDGNGLKDIGTVVEYLGNPAGIQAVVWAQLPGGVFAEPVVTSYTSTWGSSGSTALRASVVAFDVDNDSNMDLVASFPQYTTPNPLVWFQGDGTGSFSPTPTTILPDARDACYYGIFAGDLNRDSLHDLVLYAENGNWLYTFEFEVLLNQGNGTFASVGSITQPDTALVSASAPSAELLAFPAMPEPLLSVQYRGIAEFIEFSGLADPATASFRFRGYPASEWLRSDDTDRDGDPDWITIGCGQDEDGEWLNGFQVLFSDCADPICPADMTTQNASQGQEDFGRPDGVVTAIDLQFFVNAWVRADTQIADITTQNAPAGDPDYGRPDGVISAVDLQLYVNRWLEPCP